MLAAPAATAKAEQAFRTILGSWFLVTCPQCQTPLHSKLPTGISSVQCCECQGLFAVQILPPFVPQP
jgi:LSD1 subclass zinc finger protein